MAKFLEKIGAFRRKETAERATKAEAADVERATGWAEDIANAEQTASWDDLKEVEFAGDRPPENEMGGGIYEEEPNETLAALKDFFRLDMAIKNEMMRLAPEETDMYSEESRVDYADKVFKGYKDMEWRFQKINEDFRLTSPETIEKFFREGEQDFAIGKYDGAAVKGLYEQNITRMRKEFVEEVKKQCFGYGINDSGEVLGQAQSVNELLHACHSAIMNNEEILQKVPALAKKREGGYEEIALRGEESGIGRQIFEAIPEEINAGPIDIVSVDERAIMMVRDRGHALVVQAEAFEPGSKQVLVNYNIPKIINREMVEQLPGVDKITEAGANGKFVCAADEVGEKVKEFIEMVPTDADLVFE